MKTKVLCGLLAAGFLSWGPLAYAMPAQACMLLLASAQPALDPEHLPAGAVTLKGQPLPVLPGDTGTAVCNRYETLAGQTESKDREISDLKRDLSAATAHVDSLTSEVSNTNWFKRNYAYGWAAAAGMLVFLLGVLFSPLIARWLQFANRRSGFRT